MASTEQSRWWDISMSVDEEAGTASSAARNAPPTAAQRKAFDEVVQRHLAERGAAARAANREVELALQDALAEIDRRLAAQPADWQAWHLAQLRSQVAAALGAGAQTASAAVRRALERAAELGESFVPDALGAAGQPVERMAPGLSADVVDKIASFCTSRFYDISQEAAAQINVQLARVVLGVQTPFEATRTIHQMLGGDGAAMVRARRIVNTEVARVNALAQQRSMERAAESLPALKKQWRRSGKRHSREHHAAMDGTVVGVHEKFRVPLPNGPDSMMLHPLDPDAPAAQSYNCGCTCLPWMDGWQVMHPTRRQFTRNEQDAQRYPTPEGKKAAQRKAKAASRWPAAPGGVVPLPSLARAAIAAGKFGYLFHGHDVGQHKERVFTAALGFTRETAGEFERRLLASVAAAGAAHLGCFDRYGQRYWLETEVEGLNGRTMLVRSAWIVHEPGGVPHLTSAMPARGCKKGST